MPPSEVGSDTSSTDPKKKPGFMTRTLVDAGFKQHESSELDTMGSKYLYVKRVGFNDMQILEGEDGSGPAVYYVDCKAKITGWDLTIRKGSDKNGPAILQLRKGVKLARLLGWDKGTNVHVMEAPSEGAPTKPQGASPPSTPMLTKTDSIKNRQPLNEDEDAETGEVIVPDMENGELEGMDAKEVDELPARKLTTIQRKHAFRSNENTFEFDGRTYAWNYTVFLGSRHILTDVESGEEIAVCTLKPTNLLSPTGVMQMVTDWGWRLNGPLEIKDEGNRRKMEEIIVATLVCMLEWRKHNNKVWIIASSIA